MRPRLKLTACLTAAAACGVFSNAYSQEWPQKTPQSPSRPTLPGPGIQSPVDPGKPTSEAKLVKMTLTQDVAQVTPGEKFMLAAIFDIEPGWHIYWEAAGSSGSPTQLSVTAPPGYRIGRTLFPRPQAISTPEGPVFGYEGRVAIFVEVEPGPDVASDVGIFGVQADWLVCKGKCLLGKDRQFVKIPVGPKDAQVPNAAPNPAIGQFKKRLPTPLNDLAGAQFKAEDQKLVMTLPAKGYKNVQFFPLDTPGVEYGNPEVKAEGDQLIVTVPLTVNVQNAMGKQPKAAGVIGYGEGLDDPCHSFEAPIGAASGTAPQSPLQSPAQPPPQAPRQMPR